MTGERLAFERLEIERLPGLERGGFTLEHLSPGITILHGPNGSGKSTTGRAVEQLLWPEQGSGERRRVRAVLTLGGNRWEVELDHDRESWWRDGESADRPALPPAHHADRYGLALHDLLTVDGAEGHADDGGFARRVAEEAAGGFDLPAARERIGAKESPSRPNKLIQEHKAAADEVVRIKAEQRNLQEEAARLAALRSELDEARAAAARLAEVSAAVRWHEKRGELEGERGRLGRFPPELERMVGEEEGRLVRLEEEVVEAERSLHALKEKAAAARRRLEGAGLPEDGAPPEALGILNRWTSRLQEVEREVARERTELDQAEERRSRARSALGDVADADDIDTRLEALGPVEWQPLVELARRAETLRAKEGRLREMERWLGDARVPEDLDRLRDGVRVLRRWLATPAPAWRAYGPAVLGGLVWIALGGAAVGGWLALPPEWPEPLPWISLGAGALFLLWSWLDRHSIMARRRALVSEDRETGLEPPPRWTEEAVRSTLGDRELLLERRRTEVEKATLRGPLEAERRELERKASALEAERARVTAGIGAAPVLDDDVEPAPLAAFADALARWREAHLEVGKREAALASLGREHERLVAEIDAGLRMFGLGQVAGADEAASVLDDLGRRAEEHRRAQEELAVLTGPEGEIAVAQQRLEQRRAGVGDLFREVGLEPGDRAGLARLLERHPDYSACSKRVEQLGWDAARLADELPGGPEGESLRSVDPEALVAERERLAEVAGRKDELNDRIVELETLVGKAERGKELQAALARLAAADAALRAAREEEADALVAWELADWVRRSIARRHQPAVLRGTRELFRRFTRGHYELLDPEGDPPEFRARETETGFVRRLGELSAGTRVQLLLAVRLAFVEHQERGPRLPLVLDETLANSDEQAAEAVIDSLIQVAAAGRQVIYLTAQHDEVAKWQAALEAHGADGPQAAVIDLAKVRWGAEAGRRPRLAVEAARPEAPPAPEGMNRQEYAQALGVPGIEPRSPAGAVHLWYLVDDPEMLHRLLSQGFERWGQVAEMEGRLLAALLGEGDAAEASRRQLLARGRCLDALLRGWREGRGEPVDRGTLLESGAVTQRFIDEVSALAAEVDGDAERLVAALREGKVKGFRSDKTGQLEELFRDAGGLDPRPRLDREALRQRAFEAVAEEIASGALDAADVDRLLAHLPDLPERDGQS